MDSARLSQDVRALSSWLCENFTDLDDLELPDYEDTIAKQLQAGYPCLQKLHSVKHIQQQLERYLGSRITTLVQQAYSLGPLYVQDYVNEVTQQLLASEELQLVQQEVQQDMKQTVQQLNLSQVDDELVDGNIAHVHQLSEGESEVEILKLDSDDGDDGQSFGANSWGGCSFGEQHAEECIEKLTSDDLQAAALLELKVVPMDDLCALSCWDRLCQALQLCLHTTQQSQVKQDAAELVVSLLRCAKVDSPVQSAQLLSILLACVLPTLSLEVDASGASGTSFVELRQRVQDNMVFPILEVSLSALQDVANCWHFLSDQMQDDLSSSLCALLHQSIAVPEAAAACVTHNVIRLSTMAAWLVLQPDAGWWQQLWATAAVSVSLSKHFKGSTVIDLIKTNNQSTHLAAAHQHPWHGKGSSSRPQSGIRPRSGHRPHYGHQSTLTPPLQHTKLPHSRPQSAARPRSGFRSQTSMQGTQPDAWRPVQHHQSGTSQGPSTGAFQGYRHAVQRLPSVSRNQGSPAAGGVQQRTPAGPDVPRSRQHSEGVGRTVSVELHRGLLALAVLPLIISAAARRGCIQRGGGMASVEGGGPALELVVDWCVCRAVLDTSCRWAKSIATQALLEAAEQELEVFTARSVMLLIQPLQAVAAGKVPADELLKLLDCSKTAARILKGIAGTVHGRTLLVEGAVGLAVGDTPLSALTAALHRIIANQQGGCKDPVLTKGVSSVINAYVEIISSIQPCASPSHSAGIIKLAELMAKGVRQSGQGQELWQNELLVAFLHLCCSPATLHVAASMPDVLRLCCSHLANMYTTGGNEQKDLAISIASHVALTTSGCAALVKAGFIQTVFSCLEGLFLHEAAELHLLQCTPCSHPQSKLLQHAQQVLTWNHLLPCLKQEPTSNNLSVRQWLRRWLSAKAEPQAAQSPSQEAVQLCLAVLHPLQHTPGALQQLDRFLDLRKLLQSWLQPVDSAAVVRSSLAYSSSMDNERFVLDMNTAAILTVLQALTVPCLDLAFQSKAEADEALTPAGSEAPSSVQLLALELKDESSFSGNVAPRSPLEAAVCAAPGMRDGGLWLEELSHALGGELVAGSELQLRMLAIMLQRTAMVALRGAHKQSSASSRWDHRHTPPWQPLKLANNNAGCAPSSSPEAESELTLAAEVWHWLHQTDSDAVQQEHSSDTATTPEVPASIADKKSLQSLSWLMNACWNGKGGVLEQHPDFFLGLIWEIMGTHTTCEFLSHLTRSRAASYWWPQWGRAVGGCSPMVKCCRGVDFVLQHEDPSIANLLQQAGVCLAQVVSNWLRYSFIHLLTREEAIKVLCAAVVLGPDYLIYTAVALVQHLRPVWISWQVSHELATQVWIQTAKDFSLCHWFHYMQELHNKYRHLVLDILDL